MYFSFVYNLFFKVIICPIPAVGLESYNEWIKLSHCLMFSTGVTHLFIFFFPWSDGTSHAL
ncbi:hypothetical protein EL17_08515 [Anditalea andensis]|uniref:Uncharacterized protein n=1 Tax=Anditalea andensis TaxID=1048983 RepID=A0A074LK49_9BACT|nr:hypothetical protein EL17_08515 [Anditalea andensis]